MTDRNAFLPDVELVEAPFGACQLRPDGFVHMVVRSEEDSLEHARAQLEFQLQRGRWAPQLSGDARRLNRSEENSAALRIDGGLRRVIGHSSLALSRSGSPIRLVNDLTGALAWLRGPADG